jgi:hypothetical protein
VQPRMVVPEPPGVNTLGLVEVKVLSGRNTDLPVLDTSWVLDGDRAQEPALFGFWFPYGYPLFAMS